MHKSIPLKTISKKNKKPFNRDIRKLIIKRRKLKKYQTNSQNFQLKYDFLTERIGKSIETFETNLMNDLIDNSNNLYNFVKKYKNSSNVNTFIDGNGNVINDNKKIVENFKSLFESSFSVNNGLSQTVIEREMTETLNDFEISMNDIMIAMKTFNHKKAK